MNENSTRIYQRDDIIQFNYQLANSDYNCKAFRKKSSVSNRRKSLTGKLHQQSQINSSIKFLQHEDISFHINKNQSLQKTSLAFQLASKRVSVTQATRRKKVFENENDIRTKRINPTANVEQQLLNELPKQGQIINMQLSNNYSQLYKQHNKSTLTNRQTENWLNNILLEYCSDQKFDMTIENQALKRYSIDSTSLVSQGVPKQSLHRLYKGLFVYSIGFNNILKQLTRNNKKLMKTIWKVYAILLQYCAQGNFQSIITQIQKDKRLKIELFKQQIEKRQKLLDLSDELNKQKNAKFYKEFRQLKQQNKNLHNQKEILLQQFKRADQSFNEEVSLRLKFQNKINQIYGVHKQLSNKHVRLYEDHKISQYIQKKNQQQVNKLQKQILILKQGLLQQKQKYKLIQQDHHEKQQIEKILLQEKRQLNNKLLQMKTININLNHTIDDKDREIQQIKSEMNIIETILINRNMGNDSITKQFEKAMRDNKDLHRAVGEQNVQISELLYEKKIAQQNNIKYTAEISVLKMKIQQNNSILEELKQKLQSQIEQIRLNKLTLEQKTKQSQSYFQDLTQCHENIKEMRNIKDSLQQQLNINRKKLDYINDLLKQLQQQIQIQQSKINELQHQKQTLHIQCKSAQAKVVVLQQKLISERDMNKKKIQKLEEQRNILAKNQQIKSQEAQIAKLSLQKYTQLYKEAADNVKNQRFQRLNLVIRFKHSLQVVQSQNVHITDLNRIISQMTGRYEDQKRKNRNLEYVLTEKSKNYTEQIVKLKKQVDFYSSNKKHLLENIHPMIFEDLRSYIMKIENQLNIQHQLNRKITDQLKDQRKKRDILIKSYQEKIKFQQNQAQQAIALKTQQILYMNQKIVHLQSKLDKLQNQHIIQPSIQNTEQQTKYLKIIRQKTQKIEFLLKQLQQVDDQNTRLQNEILHKQHQSTNQQMLKQTNKMRKQLEQLKQLKNKNKIQFQKIHKQKIFLENKVKQFQEKNKSLQDTMKQRQNKKQKGQQIQKIDKMHENQKKSTDKNKRENFSRKLKGAVMYYKS